MKFSSKHRKSLLNQISENQYDLIIVGGGITGAGIALDASLRGLKCLLIEKQDFAAGTSSRSTKLIHGGLRYLKQLEFGLVREVGLERAIIHNNARHVVRPQKMLLPIIKNGSLGRFSSSFGLYVYDWLANVEHDERRKMLDKKATETAEPLLKTNNLIGGGLYYEYQSDDARLTIEVLKTAAENGADILNYCKADSFEYNSDGKVNGIGFTDVLKNKSYKVLAKCVVNATGPWVDKVRSLDTEVKGKKLRLTKGIHIVVSQEKLPVKQATYFDVGDKRMVFAIPRQQVVYIGTTDTFYTDNLDRPQTTEKDVDYIVNAVNRMFNIPPLKAEDVISTWAGLRPLIHEEGKDPSELSRKDEIFYAESGLISIAGGKLTGFRKMAERTVDAVIKQLNITKVKKCSTESVRYSGSDFNCEKCLARLKNELVDNFKPFDIEGKLIENLLFKYGSNSPQIFKLFKQNHSDQADAVKLIIAELQYCLANEMVLSSCDFLIRRTGRLYFDRENILPVFKLVNDYLSSYFEWNAQKIEADKVEFTKEYEAVLAFKKAALAVPTA